MLIKRWIALFMVSIILTSLAMAMALAEIYNHYDFPRATTRLVRALTLQFVATPYRELLVFVVGGTLLALSFWRLSNAILTPLMARSSQGQRLAQIVAEHRFGPDRPRFNVVAIGGGTGLNSLLRGLKHHDVAITAIVTVADDGGSTGKIRNEFNIPAPGDIRNCLVALADAESTVGKLFQYRFSQAGSTFDGHAFGNIFITALTQVTGSFEHAVIESARVLAVRGRVLPSTLDNVTLCAELNDRTILRGESSLSHAARGKAPIKRVFFEPAHARGYEPALAAILNADMIVLGPGSLFTSVLPNLMVDGVTEAIRLSTGTVAYVCNVATQPGETDGFDAADHVRAIVDHVGEGVLNYVLVNNNRASVQAIKPNLPVDPVLPDGLRRLGRGVQVVTHDLVNDDNPLRHDPEKLAAVLFDLARFGAPMATNERPLSFEPAASVRDLVGTGAR